MKKQIACVLVLCMVMLLAGCFNADGYGNEKLYFEARVIAVEGMEMMVGGGDIGLCIVDFPEGVDLSDYERGDYVEIGHSGAVADSYPAQARGYAIRKLSRDRIQEFRREVTLTGVCEAITADEIHIRTEDSRYVIRKAYLKESPILAEGDTVRIVYDGILDFAAGMNEICFPISFTVTE